MNNNEQLQNIKNEYEKLKDELKDLSEEELGFVTGGELGFELGGGTFDVSLPSLEDNPDLGLGEKDTKTGAVPAQEPKKEETPQMGVKYHHNLNV